MKCDLQMTCINKSTRYASENTILLEVIFLIKRKTDDNNPPSLGYPCILDEIRVNWPVSGWTIVTNWENGTTKLEFIFARESN